MNRMEIRRKQILLLCYTGFVIFLLCLSGRMGEKGFGYFGSALCSILVPGLFWFAPLERTVEKLTRNRIAREQYRNVGRIFRSALIYAVLVGIIIGALTYVVSDLWMDKVMHTPWGSLTLRVMCLFPLLFGVAAVCKGYFLGQGNGLPGVCFTGGALAAGIFFSLFLSRRFSAYGAKTAALLANIDFQPMYLSAGIALGLELGVLVGVLILLAVSLFYMKREQKRALNGMKKTESCGQILRLIFFSVLPSWPIIVMICLPVLTGMVLYREGLWEYLLWILLALFPILAVGCGPVRKVCQHLKKEEYRNAKEGVQRLRQWMISLSSFLAAVFMVFGEELSGSLLCSAGLCLIFLVSGICALQILWSCGRYRQVYGALALGFVPSQIVLWIGLSSENQGPVFLAVAMILLSLGLMIGGEMILVRRFKFTGGSVKNLAFPVLGAAVSGLVMLLLKSFIPWEVLCVFVGLTAHLILLVVFRCFRQNDLQELPGGIVLLKIGKIIGFYK